jgi:sulfopyruvate decarboxylase TPP-binding subunit
MNPYVAIHEQFTKIGVGLAATLPDDWVAPLISRVEQDTAIRHVPCARESEAVVVASGAFFGGIKSVVIIGATGLLTCTGELATLNLRHQIPVFCIVSRRGTIDDQRVYQEVQGRRLLPILDALDFPYVVIERPDQIAWLPDAYETCRLQKRPFFFLLARKLVKGPA